MRIAIPLWNNNVSPVLDTAERFVIAAIENGAVVSRREICFPGAGLMEKAGLIANQADMLVCGAVSRQLLSYLASLKITVYPWTMGSVDQIIQCFIAGKTPGPECTMPGCRGNRSGRCGRGARINRRGVNRRLLERSRTSEQKGRNQ